MCRRLHLILACGHQESGPFLTCPIAQNTLPRGPPFDDGRMALCPPDVPIVVHVSGRCEACFGTYILLIVALLGNLAMQEVQLGMMRHN